MNRELKFRAWVCFPKWIEKSARMVYFNLDGYADDQDHEFGDHEIDIKQNPPMLYAGLKDKNGKEIYEGDIVVYPNRECCGEVKFGYYKFGEYDTYQEGNGFYLTPLKKYGEGFFVGEEVEVIGNIWENPELMEAKK